MKLRDELLRDRECNVSVTAASGNGCSCSVFSIFINNVLIANKIK